MPIKIPSDLPARRVLEEEGVPLITEERAIRQDIRPLRIALLNLMPEKIKTERQIARQLGNTPLQIELTLLSLATHTPKTTPAEHMIAFYTPWPEVADQRFDGLIVTGAPIERLPFEAVTYWPELTALFDWAERHVFAKFFICWGAQAALYHFHGVPKYELREKLTGVYEHRLTDARSPLLTGFNDVFPVPVSRYTEVHRSDIEGKPALDILIESEEAGICLVEDKRRRHAYMLNHLEYETTTLADEYVRDAKKGLGTALPVNYFPGDDPGRTPVNSWRATAQLFYGNWINAVYQSTPFDLAAVGR